MNTRGDRRPVSTTGDRRDDTTGLRTSLRALAMVAGTAGVAAALAFPAAASAAGPAAQQRPIEAGLAAGGAGWAQDWGWRTDLYHPEWGSGWNNGYPAPGWVPPMGWAPPVDWMPPVGWAPPPGYAPPASWRGPCRGPLFNLIHPRRCI